MGRFLNFLWLKHACGRILVLIERKKEIEKEIEWENYLRFSLSISLKKNVILPFNIYECMICAVWRIEEENIERNHYEH